MEFASKEEMVAYEKAIENYYMEFLNAKTTFEFYKLWLREIFVPKYRKLKNEYDGYHSGWYRDKDGVIHALDSCFIDKDKLKDGDILVTDYGIVFAFKNNAWMRIL